MENKVDYTFTRADVERWADRPITDREWEVMASELENALDYYFNDELQRLWLDIDVLIEEDDKTSN